MKLLDKGIGNLEKQTGYRELMMTHLPPDVGMIRCVIHRTKVMTMNYTFSLYLDKSMVDNLPEQVQLNAQ